MSQSSSSGNIDSRSSEFLKRQIFDEIKEYLERIIKEELRRAIREIDFPLLIKTAVKEVIEEKLSRDLDEYFEKEIAIRSFIERFSRRRSLRG
ncbi:MAG: hypothetical protein ACTSXJ_00185 [Candidatus Baldrarchaeia archaeon]